MQESNSFTVRSGITYVATESEDSVVFELFAGAEERLVAITSSQVEEKRKGGKEEKRSEWMREKGGVFGESTNG